MGPRAPLLHAGHDRLQSDPHAEAAGMDRGMKRMGTEGVACAREVSPVRSSPTSKPS